MQTIISWFSYTDATNENSDQYNNFDYVSNLHKKPFLRNHFRNKVMPKWTPRKVHVPCAHKKIYKHTKDSMYKNQSDWF